MLMKAIPVLLLSALGLLLFSCNDTIVLEDVEIEGSPEKVSFAFVDMPYPSPYGPNVVDDIFAGSIDRFNPDSKEPPPPSSFGCFLSWANPKKKSKYLYYIRYIYVSNSFIERARNTYKQVKVRALSPEGPNGETMGIARCLVPATPNIEMMVERQFKYFADRTKPEMEINFEVSSMIVDSTLYMNSDKQ